MKRKVDPKRVAKALGAEKMELITKEQMEDIIKMLQAIKERSEEYFKESLAIIGYGPASGHPALSQGKNDKGLFTKFSIVRKNNEEVFAIHNDFGIRTGKIKCQLFDIFICDMALEEVSNYSKNFDTSLKVGSIIVIEPKINKTEA